jgi:hypothetical protein
MAMRVLLPDTKDLIELIERSDPVSTDDFAQWLLARDLRIALTFTNVSEFADTIRNAHDLLYVRSILQKLQSLPCRYLREATVEVEEIRRAVAAFDRGSEPEPPDPYVSRWDWTFTKWGKRPPAEMIVNYQIADMIFDLRGPDPRRSTRKQEALGAITADRAVPLNERLGPRQSLTTALEKKIEFWDLEKPKAGLEAFGKWIYADPFRCPGFRLAWELFHALVSNEADTLQESDVADNAHFPAIPYVDYATLDRRMTGYCRDIGKRLAKVKPTADYGGRVFRNLAQLMASIDSQKGIRTG